MSTGSVMQHPGPVVGVSRTNPHPHHTPHVDGRCWGEASRDIACRLRSLAPPNRQEKRARASLGARNACRARTHMNLEADLVGNVGN